MPRVPTIEVPIAERLRRLHKILNERVVPYEFDRTVTIASSGMLKVCNRYDRLIESWRIALEWTDGLDCALSVMLASVISTKMVGDQLWFKVIGPASCGKSTLCEAVSTNKQYVLAKSTMRGFHSGFDPGSDEDTSLLAKVAGKTLVTKDGDTLLQSPNLGQILSEARDIYDRVSRTSYRNKQSRDYEGIPMTWLLCGTSSLRSIDQSELGERFLDCVIMERIEEDLEDAILDQVAERADRNASVEVDGKPETNYEPEMAEAMALTGGYVDYLRVNAAELISQVQMGPEAKRHCKHYGKFVAYMRARPSLRQDEEHEREMGARLVSQHIRLAKCLGAVLNRTEVDAEVLRRVRKVALDTSRGHTFKIVRRLSTARFGIQARGILMHVDLPNMDKLVSLLQFLRAIGVVDYYAKTQMWNLTDRMRTLYREVVSGQG